MQLVPSLCKPLQVLPVIVQLVPELSKGKPSLLLLTTSNPSTITLFALFSASMYYYFDSKDDVVYECVKFAIEVIDNTIKESFGLSLKSVNAVLNNLFEKASASGDGVRFIAQVLASPNYFKVCRYEMAALHKRYGEYAKQISDSYGLPLDMFQPLFFIYLTLIYDYLVKGDEEYFKIQADAVLQGIEKMC